MLRFLARRGGGRDNAKQLLGSLNHVGLALPDMQREQDKNVTLWGGFLFDAHMNFHHTKQDSSIT